MKVPDAPPTAPPHAAAGLRPVELNYRFVFIDGLRAVAACSVMFFHFTAASAFSDTYRRVLPGPAFTACCHLNVGVQVFFVISGFVIAYSVRGERVTLGYLANFAARRWLRLDPPYLAAIAMTIVVTVASNRVLTVRHAAVPSVGDVVAHVFYLPVLLHRDLIIPVFWTLCLEVQFYLVFISALALGRRPATGLMAAVAVVSLASLGRWVAVPDGWFVGFWYLFLLGAMTWWAVGRRMHVGWLAGYAAAVAAVAAVHPAPEPFVGLTTAGAIVGVARAGRLGTLLGNGVVQFLGRTSYSLYLLHGLFASRVMNITRRYAGDSAAAAAATLPVCVAISVVSAWLMYRLVELPCVRLGKRVKMRREYAAAAASAAAA